MNRVATELRLFVELFVCPLVVALLPYRRGLRFAAWLARTLPIYDAAARASLGQFRRVRPDVDAAAWLAGYRLASLVDHADLYWAMTRSDGFLLSLLHGPEFHVPAGRPLVVVSFHFGQGLFVLRWLRAQGRSPRFLSVPSTRAMAGSLVEFLYGRLRIRAVERLSGAPPIFLGGARRAIEGAMEARETVYGLIDVPVRTPSEPAGEALLAGQRVRWPSSLLTLARSGGASVAVITAEIAPGGERRLDCRLERGVPDVGDLARELEARLQRSPSHWHFWYMLPAFAAPPLAIVDPITP